MSHSQFSWIANFIWGIADDVLRDLYVRGKYRDVILPMTVLRRLTRSWSRASSGAGDEDHARHGDDQQRLTADFEAAISGVVA